MSIDNISAGTYWNYSRKNDEGYTLAITGDVIEIAEVQHWNNQSKQFEWWPPNPRTGIQNPKLDLRVRLMQSNGQDILFTMAPKGVMARAIMDAYKAAKGHGLRKWRDLLGECITLATTEGQYGAQNPRPWSIQFLGKGESQVIGYEEFDTSKVQQPQAPTQPVYQAPTYQPPAYQGQPYMPPQAQPAIAQPMPQAQPYQPPMQPQMQSQMQPPMPGAPSNPFTEAAPPAMYDDCPF